MTTAAHLHRISRAVSEVALPARCDIEINKPGSMFIIDVSVIGEKRDLLTVIDRFADELRMMRRQIEAELTTNGPIGY